MEVLSQTQVCFMGYRKSPLITATVAQLQGYHLLGVVSGGGTVDGWQGIHIGVGEEGVNQGTCTHARTHAELSIKGLPHGRQTLMGI